MASGLRNIAEGSRVILMYSPSNITELYVRDTVRDIAGANNSSMFDVKTRASFMEALDRCEVAPMIAENWVFALYYDKVKRYLDANMGILDSYHSYFIVIVKNYREFLEVKRSVRKSVLELYLSYIGYYDVEYLFKDSKLPSKLIEFIARSYRDSPESIFKILEEINSGANLTSRSDIVGIVGKSTGTIMNFTFLLLVDGAKGEVGSKLFKNRVGTILELSEIYSSGTLRNFLMSTVKDILDIKVLYMMGVIYDRITDLPEAYDSKKLSRYNRFLEEIRTYRYEKILYLYELLCKSYWRNNRDVLEFMYTYYKRGRSV